MAEKENNYITDLERKLKEANGFILEIAKMLKMDIEGVGYDGIQLSLDDFEKALKKHNKSKRRN